MLCMKSVSAWKVSTSQRRPNRILHIPRSSENLYECSPPSVLHKINQYNENILSLRRDIRDAEQEMNTKHYKSFEPVCDVVIFDQLEEMYAEIADLKAKIQDAKRNKCVCFTDPLSGPCKTYDL